MWHFVLEALLNLRKGEPILNQGVEQKDDQELDTLRALAAAAEAGLEVRLAF